MHRNGDEAAADMDTSSAADRGSASEGGAERKGAGSGCRWLAVVLVCMVALRIWGVWYAEHTDEYNEVFEALRVDSGHLNTQRWYKRTFLYILAVEYGVYFSAGWVAGAFSGPDDFAAKVVRDMSPLFLMGRLTNVALAGAAMALLFGVTARIRGRRAGVIAAAILGMSALHMESSRYATVDVPVTFFVVLAFLFVVRIAQGGGQRADYRAAAFVCALAIQTKVPAAAILFPLGIAHLFAARLGERGRISSLFGRPMVEAIAFFLLGLIVGNPAILVAPGAFLRTPFGIGAEAFAQMPADMFADGWTFYSGVLARDMGLAALAFALAGVVLTMRSRRKEGILICGFIVPYYSVMAGWVDMVFPRYMIPLIPFLSILAATGIDGAIEVVVRRAPRFSWPATVAILVAVFAWPTMPVLKLEASLFGENTRYLAKRWVEANIAPGSRILMESGRSIDSQAPPLARSRENLTTIIRAVREVTEGGDTYDRVGIVDSNAVVYYELLLESVPEISYDITSTAFGENIRDFPYYVDHGYRYIILLGDVQDYYRSEEGMAVDPHRGRFYRDVAEKGALLKEFGPDTYHRGEVIRIFEIVREERTEIGDTFSERGLGKRFLSGTHEGRKKRKHGAA